MRISDILVSQSKTKSKIFTKKFFFLGAALTGLMSMIIVFVTFYGQYTGTFSLSMQRDALDKGIELSQTYDFLAPKTTLYIQPMSEIGDMLASDIDVEAARNTDGQYYDPIVPYYVAYTFYIRNTGKEMVNLNYRLRIVDSYKGVENAVKVRYIQEDLSTGHISDITYQKKSDSNLIIDEFINGFIETTTKKITIFMWFDGELTDESMLGGGIKLDMNFSITNAIGD